MKSSLYWCTIIVSVGVVLALSANAPVVLSDQNHFLRDFINHEYLNILGVILAITLASAGQLHLVFNQIEERYKIEGGLRKSRSNVHKAAYGLIALFLGGVVIVVIKPLVSVAAWAESLVNGAALIVLLWVVLILLSLVRATFRISPKIDSDEKH
jgi:formate hydrogenlyase subunit 4